MVARTSTAEISRIEEEMLRKYQDNIKKVLPPWWHSVLWSVIASFIFSGIGLFFYHIGKKDNQEYLFSQPAKKLEIVLKADSINQKTFFTADPNASR